MKQLIVLLVLSFTVAVHCYPSTGNAIMFEDDAEEDEWTMIPDADGGWHLVNVREVENELELETRVPLVVNFQLFTKLNPTTPQYLAINNTELLQISNFNAKWPTRMITHGWRNSASSPVNILIRDAYLERGNFNVIIVDWESAAKSINYIKSKRKVNDVGQQIAELIDFLHNSAGMNLKELTLIGHSLGAHASGIAGKLVKTGKINTIIAMDPASPLFSLKKPEGRVDSNDAEYVEIIHTNGGLLGFHAPIGHASFYLNWGRKQPGCGIDPSGSCSHGRSYEYFAESLSPKNKFIAIHCSGFDEIVQRQCTTGRALSSGLIKLGGEPTNHGRALGVFFIPTNSESPYGIGKMQ